jgi:hypothetical protein
MKPYLVNVPVILYVFVRPDTLKQVFEKIKTARPSVLFLVSDGPRDNVATDKEKIEASRKVVENVDWDCEVHRLYSDINRGMYTTFKITCDYVFQKVDRCIFLEDDVVPSTSFFQYCAELLEKYKNDLRISRICGMNHIGIYNEVNTDYFFSIIAPIWGFAFWRRSYELFYDFSYGDDKYIMSRLNENTKKYKNFNKSLLGYYNNEMYNGHEAGPEFLFRYVEVSQQQINILPKKNMIKNVGYGNEATHASELKKMPKGIQNMFNMETYEYNFPLKHPKYVVLDNTYEKKVHKITASYHPFISFYRKCEGLIRKIYYDGLIDIIKKVPNKLREHKKRNDY